MTQPKQNQPSNPGWTWNPAPMPVPPPTPQPVPQPSPPPPGVVNGSEEFKKNYKGS